MMPKLINVWTIACMEILSVKREMSATNKCPKKILINCDKPIPNTIPTASENRPIKKVSKTRIVEIFSLSIPKIIYRPNSFLRFRNK